jgi:hypothetical protein
VTSARWLAMFPAAAALMAQSATVTAPQPASVSGTVTNSVTGEPILRAHVIVQCWSQQGQQGQQTYGALTNAKGEFSVTGIPPGQCNLQVQRVGFVAPPNGMGYTLTSGAHKEDLKLTLIPAGAITGRVLNAAGEPMPGVNVATEMSNGYSQNTSTDDRGQFRLGGLRPGKYRVKATPQAMPFPPEIRSDGSKELRDAGTYYPGSMTAQTAQRLEVKAGAEVSDIDIKLVQTPIVQVSGKVTGLPAGAKNVMVNTFPSGQGGGVKPDGTFSLWRLDPGKYTLQAQNWAGGQSRLMSSPLEIEVTTADLDHLELRIVPAFEIAGQLRFEDEQAREAPKPPTRRDGTSPPAPPPQPRRIQLRSLNRYNGMGAQAVAAADDSFALENVQPVRYRVTVTGVSGYVKSIRAGETETDGEMLDVRNGSPGPVTVTLSSNFCEVSGTVSDSDGPVKDAPVALVPVDDPSDSRIVSSDANGTYKFRVAPGKYKLAAVDEDAMTWGFQGPELDDYQPETIDLSAGDKIAKDLLHRK